METLYRKYRPIDFETVVGQETVIKTLKNQIAKGSIAHAYLFCGTRGTGKTTIAKIFARAINCPNEKNGNPCNECNTCKSALDSTNLNIIEMDAASNRGVEDIRRISDLLAYPPINDEKYKVFIIDEAHALTSTAAQAFLKILEEPPEYVVYILATTDPNKLPETILSRCQKYNFKRINIDTIVAYLKKICEKEKIEIDDDALAFIAEKSDGSMRESISKLDRARAYAYNEKLTKELVTSILGIVGDDDFSKLTKYINEGNIKDAIEIISDCIDRGKDIIQFTNDFVWHLRNLLIIKDLKEAVESLNITKQNFEKYKKESENISKDTLIYFIEILSKTANNMKFDENRRVILETALVRLASPRSSYIEEAVMARLSNIEDSVRRGTYVKVSEKDIKEDKKEEKVAEIRLSKATFDEVKKITESWKTLVSSLDKMEKAILSTAKPIPGNEKESGQIKVLINNSYDYKLLKDGNKIKNIEEKLKLATENLIQKEIIFKIENLDETKYSKDLSLLLEETFEKINMELKSDK